jgi:dihydrofolate reductase
MRKIVVMLSVSLDGYVEGPDHDLGWHLVDEELHTEFNRRLAAMSAFLEGRVMFEMMAAYWPTADADPTAEPPIVEFARIWRDMPKVVYSRTLESAGWGATIVRDVVPDEVRALKDQPGGDLALGGARLAATFLRHGLVDEYLLYVHPVAIGAGTPLFPPGTHVSFRLVETKTFGNGVVLLRYAR